MIWLAITCRSLHYVNERFWLALLSLSSKHSRQPENHHIHGKLHAVAFQIQGFWTKEKKLKSLLKGSLAILKRFRLQSGQRNTGSNINGIKDQIILLETGPPISMFIWATQRTGCLQGKGSTFIYQFFKTLGISLAKGIEPTTACSAVKCSTNWAYPAGKQARQFKTNSGRSRGSRPPHP